MNHTRTYWQTVLFYCRLLNMRYLWYLQICYSHYQLFSILITNYLHALCNTCTIITVLPRLMTILPFIQGCGNITSLFQRAIKQDIENRKVLILFHIEITSWKFCFTQFWKSYQLGDVPHCPYTAYTEFGCLPWPS